MRMLAKQIYRRLPLKRPIFEWMRTRFSLPQNIYQHLHFEGPFNVKIDDEHMFRMHSGGSYLENELFWGGYGKSWEAMSLNVWTAMCRRAGDGLILDIGANSGAYALAGQSLAPSAEVVAFEPLTRMAAKVRRNAALNDMQLNIVEMAVSDHTGTLPIFDVMIDNNYSASLEGQGPDAQSYDVDICSIDSFLAERPAKPVAAIKIDIERHEPAALRGMVKTLERHRPPVLIEILDADVGKECSEALGGIPYARYTIIEEGGLRPTRELAPAGGHDWNHLLCMPDDFDQMGLGRYLLPSALSRS